MLPEATPLTRRESEAIRLSAESKDGVQEVAVTMGIGIQRVKTLRWHAYKKLGVSGPNALILAIRKLGIR